MKYFRETNEPEVPYDEIDEGIVDVVRFLNKHGFRTTGACEGGDGHAFNIPTVQIAPNGDLDSTRKELCRFLVDHGAQAFTLRTVSMHQKSHTPERYSYVELEFWSQATLRYFMC